MNNDKLFYVYVLLDPRKQGIFTYEGVDTVFDYEPFYVGKGTGNRWKRHVTRTENSNSSDLKRNTINSIIGAGYPEIPHIKLVVSSNELEIYDEEFKAIQRIGRKIDRNGPLTNIKDGGVGGVRAGQYNPHYGVPNSPETRLKISKALKGKYTGKNCSRYGVPWTAEAKQKLSDIHKGKVISEEVRSKMHLSNTKIRYSIMTPKGTLDIAYSLNAYSKFRNIDSSCLLKTRTPKLDKTQRSHKGYYIVTTMQLPDNWREDPELLSEYFVLELRYA